MAVAVLVSSISEGTETFVKEHIRLLGKNTKVFYGGLTPFLDASDKNKEDASLFEKIKFMCLKRLGLESDLRTYLLKKLIRKEKINCCYAEFGPVGVGALNACKSTNTKLVVNFHGYDAFKKDILESYSADYKKLFEYSSHIVGVSQDMLKQLNDIGCPKEKLVYLPCLPNDRFSTLNYAPKEKQLTFIGRFVEKKGPWLTLLAFKTVLETHPDAKLVMAGDGPLLSVCSSLAKVLHINNVTFLGAIDHTQVADLYQTTMIYVQHSIIASSGDREGTPVSIMEAMSAGIPVVSTRHQGIKDFIEHDVTGLLVDEQDTESMAQEICNLLSSPTRQKQISSAAKASLQAKVNAIDAITVLNSMTSGTKHIHYSNSNI